MEVAGRFHSLDVLPQGTLCTYWMIKKITLFYGTRMGLNVTFRRTVLFFYKESLFSLPILSTLTLSKGLPLCDCLRLLA
jgi:hypothetical protein